MIAQNSGIGKVIVRRSFAVIKVCSDAETKTEGE
jgi:hypothetical protein